MGYEVQGKIIRISEVEVLANGAQKCFFRIDTGESRDNILDFEVYKTEANIQHMANFKKYNKVGDNVNIEFNLKAYHWSPEDKDKIILGLSCWKCSKIDQGGSNEAAALVDEFDPGKDDLPF